MDLFLQMERHKATEVVAFTEPMMAIVPACDSRCVCQVSVSAEAGGPRVSGRQRRHLLCLCRGGFCPWTRGYWTSA